MNRVELWKKLKDSGITRSQLPNPPSDSELKIVIQHAQVSAKALLDFICSLDG